MEGKNVADQNQNLNSASFSGSPWDEPLDLPEEEEKKEVVGTLEETETSNQNEPKAGAKPVPFNIPEGIDDEKVGRKIPAEEIVEKEKNKLKLPPKEQATPVAPGPEANEASRPSAEVDPVGKPVNQGPGATKSSQVDTGGRVNEPAATKPTVDSIAKPRTRSDSNQPETQPKAATSVKDRAEINKIKENDASLASPKSPEVSATTAAPQPEELKTPQEKPKEGLFSKINPFSKNKKPQKPVTTTTTPVAPASAQPKAASVSPAKTPKPKRKPIKIDFYKKPGFVGVASAVLIFAALTFLTENGLVSVGIEKIYGIVGLEQLWGGLPRNPEAALAKSFVSGRDNIEFKAKGEITLTVDKTIDSDITSPLVAVADFIYLARDIEVGPRTKAMFTQADYYYDDSYYEYDYNDDSNSSAPSSDLDDSYNNDSLESDGTSSFIYDSSSQGDYQSYTTDTSTIKEVNADFESVSGNDGTKTDFTINKITGRNSSVSMITNQNDLYINTSSDIEYHKSAENNKWLDYTISTPESQNVLDDIYSLKTNNGFSIIGRRISNEKISDTRCYRYQIDSLEIGSSLEFLGIKSEMVQKISGDVWIGIKDQLIHKIDVTVIPSISSSVSRIDLEVEFYDYGSNNIIEIPRLDQKIVVSTEDNGEGESLESDGDDEEIKNELASAESKRDGARKADLKKVKSALEEYYDDNGYYPVSSNWSNINQSSSTLVTKLIPEYLSSVPEDPKSAEGYYYGYKSDGKSYTLSARFENLSDPEITNVSGDIWLHYVYSDN